MFFYFLPCNQGIRVLSVRVANSSATDILVELYKSYPDSLITKSIMIGANLESRTIKSAMIPLIENGLCEKFKVEDRRTNYFKLTKKGYRLMTEYENIRMTSHGE